MFSNHTPNSGVWVIFEKSKVTRLGKQYFAVIETAIPCQRYKM